MTKKMFSKAFIASVQPLVASAESTLKQIAQAFEGKALSDGAEVLAQVEAKLAELESTLSVSIDTPAGKYVTHYLLAEVVLGDVTCGAYKLSVYVVKYSLFPFAYLHPI